MYNEKRVDRSLHLAMLGAVGLALTPFIFVAGVWLGATTMQAGLVAGLVGITAFTIESRARRTLSEEHEKLVEEL